MLKRKIVNDILLVACLLIAVLIVFVIFKSNLKDGNYVKITIDNKVKDCYNFNEDGEYTIISGKNTNVLVIKDGTAFIKSADCPDKICVHHPPISKVGETIVCLPHKVVVEIIKE